MIWLNTENEVPLYISSSGCIFLFQQCTRMLSQPPRTSISICITSPPLLSFFSSFFPLSPFTLDYLGFQGNARCLAAIQTQCHLPAECAQRTASDHPARKMGAASVSTRAAFASSTTWKECAVSSVAPRTLKHSAGACGTVRETTLSQINIYR